MGIRRSILMPKWAPKTHFIQASFDIFTGGRKRKTIMACSIMRIVSTGWPHSWPRSRNNDGKTTQSSWIMRRTTRGFPLMFPSAATRRKCCWLHAADIWARSVKQRNQGCSCSLGQASQLLHSTRETSGRRDDRGIRARGHFHPALPFRSPVNRVGVGGREGGMWSPVHSRHGVCGREGALGARIRCAVK
ncbi:TPA: hypothetical protein N0F65_006139 [Lagenidium giganteum]|uniref:Uncharacterized protein n=1 Tax=Lagenidium giganteum TaxID=4803 RepID=A0AAV2YS71_9STRA|nr:TPA: hypothetical protein N0F65_005857 [Lagenidium giganteum]DBA00939.1 TPA: hypothetical protein N0F65_006139 [Lagenidium giganteum]